MLEGRTIVETTNEDTGKVTREKRAELRVAGDLLLEGYQLKGADIVDSSLTGLDELGVTWLTVRGASGNTLPFFTGNGTVKSLPGSSVSPDGTLMLSEAGIKTLAADMNAGDHTIKNLNIEGTDQKKPRHSVRLSVCLFVSPVVFVCLSICLSSALTCVF